MNNFFTEPLWKTASVFGSLSIAYTKTNDAVTYWLPDFILLNVLFVFLYLFVKSTTTSCTETNFLAFIIKQCGVVSRLVFRSGLFQPYLVVNGRWIRLATNLSYILSPLTSQKYLSQSISAKLTSTFILFLMFICAL